ncbi:rho guanine nucleotide exchange factor 9 isoform X2 [Thrips palmi]|uniref:Rho guanine nucleotide exchange factor 9 isoform X2 n=1 Tax=Thrips palmi TaxID=161013 RepID=A0A6P8Z396_THRPL|nr:rho guanine nucleotide exchange factor 9 isoform X2 [Thrips palmi]
MQRLAQRSSSESILSKVKKSLSMVVRKDSIHKGPKCKEKDCPCQKDNQKGCQQRYAQKLATEGPAPNQPAPPPPPLPPTPTPARRESSASSCCSETCCVDSSCKICKEAIEGTTRLGNNVQWADTAKERPPAAPTADKIEKLEPGSMRTLKPRKDKKSKADKAKSDKAKLDKAKARVEKAEKAEKAAKEAEAKAQAEANAREAARVFLGARKEVVIRRASSEPRVNDASQYMYKESTHPSSVTQSEDEVEPPRNIEFYRNRSDSDTDEEAKKKKHVKIQQPAQQAAPPAKPKQKTHQKKLKAVNSDEMDITTPALSGEDLRHWVDRNLARGRQIVSEAVWDNPGLEPEGLQFKAGDTIVITNTEEHNWWWGIRNQGRGDEELGRFPMAAVRVRIGQDHYLLPEQEADESHQAHMRCCVVEEIINSEREFVKTLRDLYEGFMKPAEANGLFNQVHVRAVFGNLEDILNFQTVFLKDLEAIMDWTALENGLVGEVFMRHVEGFRIYVEYCNGHTQANVMLQDLLSHDVYAKFFEECRVRRGMQPISLDGYLLTPVQRICKYPLQLNELYKYTNLRHPDYSSLRDAVISMRGMATHVNECKRRTEGLVKMSMFQAGVLDWEGRDLIDDSSLLIYQGSVVQVVPGHFLHRRLYMFDNQIIICKRKRTFFEQVPKRGLVMTRCVLQYRGRLILQMCEVEDVSGATFFGRVVKFGLRVGCGVRNRSIIFQFPNKTVKDRWLEAFKDERRLVHRDRRMGVVVSAADRNRARLAALRVDRQDMKMEKHLLTKVQKEGKKAPKERVRSRSQGRTHADDKKWYKKF